ncbi:MAG: hypothetical protein JSU85_08710 [Candidatus Zixiibacteriota bacterium]|nr:MAG: hypothetical protein JSU85_08710 [candidate division Zixibacteria bacterium]
MAEFFETTFIPPQPYTDAHQGADEADDLRLLHSSAAVIRFGGVPIVAVENLNISITENRTPIYVVGSISPIAFDIQNVAVNISGSLVQMAIMSLAQTSFYPKSEADIIASINRVFNIDIFMIDHTNLDPAELYTEPFLTVKNVQKTGNNFVINPSTMIKDSFTAVATFVVNNREALKNYNRILEAA